MPILAYYTEISMRIGPRTTGIELAAGELIKPTAELAFF